MSETGADLVCETYFLRGVEAISQLRPQQTPTNAFVYPNAFEVQILVYFTVF
jgi:hypothetical protein